MAVSVLAISLLATVLGSIVLSMLWVLEAPAPSIVGDLVALVLLPILGSIFYGPPAILACLVVGTCGWRSCRPSCQSGSCYVRGVSAGSVPLEPDRADPPIEDGRVGVPLVLLVPPGRVGSHGDKWPLRGSL